MATTHLGTFGKNPFSSECACIKGNYTAMKEEKPFQGKCVGGSVKCVSRHASTNLWAPSRSAANKLQLLLHEANEAVLRVWGRA